MAVDKLKKAKDERKGVKRNGRQTRIEFLHNVVKHCRRKSSTVAGSQYKSNVEWRTKINKRRPADEVRKKKLWKI